MPPFDNLKLILINNPYGPDDDEFYYGTVRTSSSQEKPIDYKEPFLL